ncbi:DUF3306 domain-containing protein [Limnobacter parvus]|uniref:DUF3306 domain-containing protein n=1 Tax=Limnobacter parvus TaxID=2939690 RepID=A0ABT1XLA2_9BURK|nr:DUF3306 domain-containing protein [Limnobacter parvus]MCR2746884.1 DUF3306 domain-containing protein [Limnobacter parvus]
MSDNFLSRWSKRKLEAREQEKLAESSPLQQVTEARQLAELPADDAVVDTESLQATPPPELPLPTEADLLAVEQGGDIKAFMVEKVSTELRNKAFKALFSRPEFNVMDGLDIYIDDYNKFTPLTQEDIGKMTLSKQLLSRPDLDVLNTEDIQTKVKELVSTVQDPVEVDENVLDKPNVEKPLAVAENEEPEGPRVIPDGLQVADSEQLIEERSFENLEQKPR